MIYLRYIAKYSGKSYLMTLCIFILLWHVLSVSIEINKIRNRVNYFAQENLINIERALKEKDIFSLKKILWKIKNDRIKNIRLDTKIADKMFKEIFVGEKVSKNLLIKNYSSKLVLNGHNLGTMTYGLNNIEINMYAASQNILLYILISLILVLLLVFANFSQIKTMLLLEKSLNEFDSSLGKNMQDLMDSFIKQQSANLPKNSISQIYANT